MAQCQGDRVSWNAGRGGCETYAPGYTNNYYCSEDVDNGLVAWEACHECGMCTGSGSESRNQIIN